jgi:hypothetical protein
MVEGIFLSTVDSAFDREQLLARLSKQFDSIEGTTHIGDVIVTTGFASSVPSQLHYQETHGHFSHTPMIQIGADVISFFDQHYGSKDEILSCIRFMTWVLSLYQCQIRDEYGNDWTERYRVGGVDVFYDPRLFAAITVVEKLVSRYLGSDTYQAGSKFMSLSILIDQNSATSRVVAPTTTLKTTKSQRCHRNLTI